mmetsp:Transcript_32011/g.76351  ORF Transcript_32011/g.76351 Transcript_32011/m.76351 type:complete len:304 (-) Transcript_32011:133-1044(-)
MQRTAVDRIFHEVELQGFPVKKPTVRQGDPLSCNAVSVWWPRKRLTCRGSSQDSDGKVSSSRGVGHSKSTLPPHVSLHSAIVFPASIWICRSLCIHVLQRQRHQRVDACQPFHGPGRVRDVITDNSHRLRVVCLLRDIVLETMPVCLKVIDPHRVHQVPVMIVCPGGIELLLIHHRGPGHLRCSHEIIHGQVLLALPTRCLQKVKLLHVTFRRGDLNACRCLGLYQAHDRQVIHIQRVGSAISQPIPSRAHRIRGEEAAPHKPEATRAFHSELRLEEHHVGSLLAEVAEVLPRKAEQQGQAKA